MKLPYPRVNVDECNQQFVHVVERIMQQTLPPHFFTEADPTSRLTQILPLIRWTPLAPPPFDLSFFIWSPFRANAYRFFYEMVTRWLIPGKRLNALLQFAIDFSLPEFGPQKYIGGEVRVHIATASELETLQRNLTSVETEIRRGMESYYQACRILEIKGLSSDEKTALIRDNISALVKNRPQDFDYDILAEMQRFLVLCKDEFKHARSWRHMSRVICTHYLFRKTLKFSLEAYPERRYINVKLVRAALNSCQKRVVGVAIGMSYLKEHERFEAEHILNGIRSLIPNAMQVPGSFFTSTGNADSTLTAYLEVENENLTPITFEEERTLKKFLASELKSRIEQRRHTVFMPQNEETLMRHILVLSAELKYARDLPQVIIEFAQQTEDKLEFLVVALRVGKPGLKPMASYFESMQSFLTFLPERTKSIGWPHKQYTKEASVFHLRLSKHPFLRADCSVDIVQARRAVADELTRIIGTYRDYNGGILAKENEVFEALRREAGSEGFFLENYFYSIQPPFMRSLLPPQPLLTLFNMILQGEREGLAEGLPYQISMHSDPSYLYLLITARNPLFQEFLASLLKPFEETVATCRIQELSLPYFGLICRDPQGEEALNLRMLVEEALVERQNL